MFVAIARGPVRHSAITRDAGGTTAFTAPGTTRPDNVGDGARPRLVLLTWEAGEPVVDHSPERALTAG